MGIWKWAGVVLGLVLAFIRTLLYDGLHIQGRWGVGGSW